jgi:hypothetical protein
MVHGAGCRVQGVERRVWGVGICGYGFEVELLWVRVEGWLTLDQG